MDDHFQSVSEAFSRKAASYDEFGRGHVNLERMRGKVYAHIAGLVPTGGKLLEINAGTGLDAAEMVRRGYRVHTTDIAPGMLAKIEQKIAQGGLQGSLTVQSCSFTELDRVVGGPYDGIYSNLGGLNCTGDLAQVTRHLPGLLAPGGVVTWVIMPRICPWELALLLRDFRVATRRLRGSVLANVEGVKFVTTYYSPADVRRAFGPRFQQVRLEGLSVFTPPADHKTFPLRFPRLYRLLAVVDDWASRRFPFNHWGDFFIISMRYEG